MREIRIGFVYKAKEVSSAEIRLETYCEKIVVQTSPNILPLASI